MRRGAWAGGIAGINEVYGSATLAEALVFGEAVGLDKQTVLHVLGPRNFENARRKARAGVRFSFGIGLPFFGAVVAPAPAYVLPPAYYPYPYPPLVAYGPPGYYGGSVVVWGGHYRDGGRHGGWRRRHWD